MKTKQTKKPEMIGAAKDRIKARPVKDGSAFSRQVQQAAEQFWARRSTISIVKA